MPPLKSNPFLPYARQQIDASDIAAVDQVLRGDYLTTGPAVTKFESSLAARLGARFAVSCSSGTAALHLACMALGLGPGDSVIVPSITFLATANAVRMVGADVIFADVDPENGLLTPAALTAAIERGEAQGAAIKAAIPVHLAGQTPDMSAIAAICQQAGITLIEDACHAVGTYHACADGSAAPVGACRLSSMAVFSFHPVKTVAAGEGGAVSTNDPVLKDRLERLRCHGMTRVADQFENADLAFDDAGQANPWYYEMPEIGFNYRLSDIHAALADNQLSRLRHFIEERRTLANLYDDALAPHSALVSPIRRSRQCHPAWHLYPVLIDFDRLGITRADVVRDLHLHGIGTQVHYVPVHRQPYYQRQYGSTHLPDAEEYYRRTLSLPLFVGMIAADVSRVVTTLHTILTDRTDKLRSPTATVQLTYNEVPGR